MKPGLFAGTAALLALALVPASAQFDPFAPFKRLPGPPPAKALTPKEKAEIERAQAEAELAESIIREQSRAEGAGLDQFAPHARGYTGKPTNPNEPINITLVSPAQNQVMASSTVRLVLDVQNFILAPGGNRLHVILDNGSPVEYTSTREPVTFTNVEPGGHTLRVYAVGPDGRMLKTPGSYLLRYFFVKRRDVNHHIAPDQPYVTVNLPPEGTVLIPEDGKIWFDFHAHNAPLAKEGGYTVHYRINGLHHQLDRDQGVFWENLQPGKYELEVMLKDKLGQTVPGIPGGTRRTFLLQQPAGTAPPPTTTPAPQVVFDQVPGYDPNPLSVTSMETSYSTPSGDDPTLGGPLPNSSPISPDVPATAPAPPEPEPAPQRVIRSAPAITEEQASEADKDKSVIDLDAE
ncbi:MAG: hypothetical protein AAGK14_15595 [Verrucomicrobiota bacterium]